MRLELHEVVIRRIEWGDRTGAWNGVLTVNREEAAAEVAKDERFASVRLDLAHPGEKVRIIPVKDVVEPRVKLARSGEPLGYFPGFFAPAGTAGKGLTLVLRGAAVVTCGPIVAFQEGFIDMSGPGAAYTPFSETANLVLTVEPDPRLTKHAYEEALRLAGLRLAVYLATAARNATPDAISVYEKGNVTDEAIRLPDLPRVLHVCMAITQGLLHDTFVHGGDMKASLPVLLHPNEVLDGAVVSGNCVSACDKNTTWHHQNDPVVRALYRRHGEDLNFLGVVVTPEDVRLAGKERAASMNAALAESLGATGVIITEEGYGNPDTDLCLNAKQMERRGIRTVIIADEAAGTDGASQGLADSTPEIAAFVSTGNVNEMIEVPAMECVLGYPDAIALLSGGAPESLRSDGSMFVELQSVIGSTCELGAGRWGCAEF